VRGEEDGGPALAFLGDEREELLLSMSPKGSRRNSACRMARRTRDGRNSERRKSSSVRATVVTGIPRRTATKSGRRFSEPEVGKGDWARLGQR
jgi:hypothetical protein